MKAAQLKDIKSLLEDLSHAELLQICLRLAKFKKENKELLTYILLASENEADYVNQIKERLDFEFSQVNDKHLYFAKKGIRRVVRIANQFMKYTQEKTSKVEILLHIAAHIKNQYMAPYSSNEMQNIFLAQIKKIVALIAELHEDLQYDYQKQLNEILEH